MNQALQQKRKESSLRKTKLKLRGKKEKKLVCARLKLSYGPKSGFAAKKEKKVVCARLN